MKTSTNLSISELSRIILSPHKEHQQHRISFGVGMYKSPETALCAVKFSDCWHNTTFESSPICIDPIFALTWLARWSQNTSYSQCLSNKCFLKIMIILLRTSVFSIKYCSAWCLSLKTSRFMMYLFSSFWMIPCSDANSKISGTQ